MSRLLRRLRGTSAREIAARGADTFRIAAEAVRVASTRPTWRRDQLRLTGRSAELLRARRALEQRDWPSADAALRAQLQTRAPRFVINPATRDRFTTELRARFPDSIGDAVRQAEPLLAGRYDLLGYRALSFDSGGGSVDWHFDPVHRRHAPRRFWARVPYLEPACGDHKIIWELNRHQHWLALGRAAWLTGEARYAEAAADELDSWLAANPPLIGINWASMLELALRSISWIWALHLFAGFDVPRKPLWLLDLLTGLDRQLEHISRHLSTWFSPNTHLLGESLALYVAGRSLPELEAAPRWERTGRAILLQEARAQVHPDGGHVELSMHYHRYALDFYLLALLVARRTGDDAAGPLAEVAMRLASFCRALADESGRLPTIGDDDGGMLFPMCGREPADVRDSLALAAALFSRPELAVSEPPEEAFWMLGGEGARLVAPPVLSLPSRLFPDSGYAVIRADREHAVFDVGHHGFLNGGHAHADALSFILTVGGRPLLVDPGTGSYTVDPEQRDRFRSTAMHNTLVVDGRPQSEPAGPFHWASRADARVTFWRPAVPAGESRTGTFTDFAEAEHDGYRPLRHRRSVLRIPGGPWLVTDHLLGAGHHRLDLHWHLDPAWTPDHTGARFTAPGGPRAALASTADALQVFHGDPDGLGWCAPVYGRIVPSTTLRASSDGTAPLSVVTAIAASRLPLDLGVEPARLLAEGGDGWHRTAVTVRANAERWLVALGTPAGDTAAEPTEYRIACPHGELATDARVALMRFSVTGDPSSISLIAGTKAQWTGRSGFSLAPLAAPQDVHVEGDALGAGIAAGVPAHGNSTVQRPHRQRNTDVRHCRVRRREWHDDLDA